MKIRGAVTPEGERKHKVIFLTQKACDLINKKYFTNYVLNKWYFINFNQRVCYITILKENNLPFSVSLKD